MCVNTNDNLFKKRNSGGGAKTCIKSLGPKKYFGDKEAPKNGCKTIVILGQNLLAKYMYGNASKSTGFYATYTIIK